MLRADLMSARDSAERSWWSVRLLTIGLALGGTVFASALVAKEIVRQQAAAARRPIGKPLGEEALAADRTCKKKYGDPLDLLLLGDLIAAGLGAETRKQTLGAQLAKRLARRTG